MAAKSVGMSDITVLLPQSHIYPGHAPIALVNALGYAEADGLKVRNVVAGSPMAALEGVVAGKGDVTFINTAFGFIARDTGKPFKMFYSLARHMNRSFAVPEKSPITSVPGLRGTKIALHFEDLHYFAQAALADEGVDAANEINFVPWRGGLYEVDKMLASLRAGQVKAVWLLDLAYGLFQAAHYPMRRLPARTLDRMTPSASIFAHDRTIDSRADALGLYGRAVAKSTLFAMTNPEAAVRLVWQSVPESRPHPKDEARALCRDLAVLRVRLENSRIDNTKVPRWGAITEADIVAWQDFMLRSGAIKRRRPPSEYFTGGLVDVFNDFDADKVVRQARSYGKK